jgi:hypothetical protein
VTFAVRTITRSAAGGDIVHRPRVIDAREVSVGRGADRDIQLADLAVSLSHARLVQAGPGRVLAEATGDQPFEVAGRFTKRADLSLSDGPRLTFGSHVLALSAGDDDTVLVDVTRLQTAPEGASAANEERIFSLTASLGKRPAAWSFAALALALCLIWPIAGFVSHANRRIHADQQWSAGPLSKSHAFLAKDCQACHVKAFVSVRDETCLACHRKAATPEASRLVAETEKRWGGPETVALVKDHADHALLLQATPLPADLRGKAQALLRRQFNHPNDRCASCHLEHLADTAPKAGAAAGSAPPPMLPRATPTLRITVSCVACHDRIRERLDSTSLRDTPDWSHHPDFRPLIARTPLGSAPPVLDRISLVERPSDYTGLIFSHQEHLSKSGGVARMAAGLGIGKGGSLACADCHRPIDPAGAPGSGPGGFARVEMVRDCSACHSLAFAPGAGGGPPQVLPHGHPDQVVATLERYYAGGGAGRTPEFGRRPPGFLANLGGMVATPAAYQAVPGAAAARIRALFAPRGLCGECHAVAAPIDPASLDYRIDPIHLTQRYLPRGAFDHRVPEHSRDAAGNPNCESCHRETASASASDVMLPRVAECAACHGKTKAKVAAAASGDCAECHSYHAPGMATPKADAAARTPPAMPSAGGESTGRALAAADPVGSRVQAPR